MNKKLKELYAAADARLSEIHSDKNEDIIEVYSLARMMSNKEHFGNPFIDFSKLSIEDKIFHGWLRPDFIFSESLINGRWSYWLDIVASQKVENKPIPQLRFYHSYRDEFKVGEDMLEQCLDVFKENGVFGYDALKLFVDWFLYAMGSSEVKELPREITKDNLEKLYVRFKPQYLLLYPSDYLVVTATHYYGKGKFNANAFYPTPSTVVQCMNEIVMSEGEDIERLKYKSVIDPCCGTGIMLLYASNKSLRIYGNDIDLLMTRISMFNGYLYVPWMVEVNKETSRLLESYTK